MTRALVVALLCLPMVARAQAQSRDAGKKSDGSTYENPFAAPPAGAPPALPAPTPEPTRSPPAFTFGIRVGVGASGYALSTAVVAPTVGASLFLTDNVKALLDLGFALGANGTSTSFALGVGVEYLFLSRAAALRPLLFASTAFTVTTANNVDTQVGLGFQVGGGAEYFFSSNFSVSGRLGLALPLAWTRGTLSLGFFTFTPGLGAAFYF